VPRPSLDKVSFWHCSFWSPAETFLIVMDFTEKKNIFFFLFYFPFSMLLFLLFCLLCSCPQMFYSLSALDSTSSCCGQVNQPVWQHQPSLHQKVISATNEPTHDIVFIFLYFPIVASALGSLSLYQYIWTASGT